VVVRFAFPAPFVPLYSVRCVPLFVILTPVCCDPLLPGGRSIACLFAVCLFAFVIPLPERRSTAVRCGTAFPLWTLLLPAVTDVRYAFAGALPLNACLLPVRTVSRLLRFATTFRGYPGFASGVVTVAPLCLPPLVRVILRVRSPLFVTLRCGPHLNSDCLRLRYRFRCHPLRLIYRALNVCVTAVARDCSSLRVSGTPVYVRCWVDPFTRYRCYCYVPFVDRRFERCVPFTRCATLPDALFRWR